MYFTFNVVFLFSGGTSDQSSAMLHEVIAMAAIVTGFIAAIMGIGGAFILVPAMIYICLLYTSDAADE